MEHHQFQRLSSFWKGRVVKIVNESSPYSVGHVVGFTVPLDGDQVHIVVDFADGDRASYPPADLWPVQA